MQINSDWRLLEQYLDTNSHGAFSQLVDKHIKMVYWTCRRDLGNAQSAEDATQVVFVLLAQKAASLRRGVSISDWLYSTARFVSKNAVRREVRKKRLEEEIARTMQGQSMHDANWSEVEPWLNDAVSALPASDREVVIMRYFEGLSHQEVADSLGTTEVAVRKRSSRAIDKLRGFLRTRDVHVTSAVLVALLIEQCTVSVPQAVQAATLQSVQNAASGHGAAFAAHSKAAMLHHGVTAALDAARRKAIVMGIAGAVAGAGIVAVPIVLVTANRPVQVAQVQQSRQVSTDRPAVTAMPPVPAKHVPLIIYNGETNDVPYSPSGYIGNSSALDIDPACTDHPHSGSACMRITYKATSGWAGVIWQDPPNDWGDLPGGYNLTGARELSFWARGATGDEVVTFTYGTIKADKPYHDSSSSDLKAVQLTTDWKRYSMDLSGKDLSCIKTGFSWTAASTGAPVTFYLDDVEYQ
ncbi:MAG: sigma-70 family RNA polymerase sigma factor [Capsulimonadaceae bacterium]